MQKIPAEALPEGKHPSLPPRRKGHACLPAAVLGGKRPSLPARRKGQMAVLIPVVLNKAFAQDLPHVPYDDESIFVQLVDQFF